MNMLEAPNYQYGDKKENRTELPLLSEEDCLCICHHVHTASLDISAQLCRPTVPTDYIIQHVMNSDATMTVSTMITTISLYYNQSGSAMQIKTFILPTNF